MTHVNTPQTRCVVGVARCDITPPVGIYHRMWGAARHDRAAGVHRSLLATALWLEPRSPGVRDSEPRGSQRLTPELPIVLIAMDHCVVDSVEMTRLRHAVADASGLAASQVHITLSHTHGSGWMSRSRSHFPGGELIGPYLDDVTAKLAMLATDAKKSMQPATFIYGQGRCNLAAHRDFFDERNKQFVCGFNPNGTADDTVMVARVHSADSKCLATIINYACHPTTLAWDNTLVSPDYVGAMREIVEGATGAPCIFLQGASGDLGPREGFVGDTAIADRNGKQLGYAALSALESLPVPGTRFTYAGPVVSGTTIGTWRHEPLAPDVLTRQESWQIRQRTVELAYRHDLPDLDETKAEHVRWQQEEAQARAAGDERKSRDCRAMVEQMNRRITRLSSIPAGKVFPYEIRVARLGDAIWILTPGELYQTFQTTLRTRFPAHPLIIATLTNDWQPGYVPAASAYGYGIYQDAIACVAAGSLEVLIEALTREITGIV